MIVVAVAQEFIYTGLLKSKEHPFFQFRNFHIISGDCSGDCVGGRCGVGSPECVDGRLDGRGCAGENASDAYDMSGENASDAYDMSGENASDAVSCGRLSANMLHSSVLTRQCPMGRLGCMSGKLRGISQRGHSLPKSRLTPVMLSPLIFSSFYFLWSWNRIKAFLRVSGIVDLCDLLS